MSQWKMLTLLLQDYLVSWCCQHV